MRIKISNSNSFSLGFTLIELVIVFSVIAILSVVSVASFVSYGRVQAISNDANNIVNVINLAKSNAVSQVKPTSCLNADNSLVLQGYGITIITGSKYTIDVYCSGTPPSHIVYTYPLSKNVTFKNTTDVSTVFFPVISGAIILKDINGLEVSRPRQIVLADIYGNTKIICVNSDSSVKIILPSTNCE